MIFKEVQKKFCARKKWSQKKGGNRTGNKMVFKHTSKFQLELFKITVLWMVFKTEEMKKKSFWKSTGNLPISSIQSEISTHRTLANSQEPLKHQGDTGRS